MGIGMPWGLKYVNPGVCVTRRNFGGRGIVGSSAVLIEVNYEHMLITNVSVLLPQVNSNHYDTRQMGISKALSLPADIRRADEGARHDKNMACGRVVLLFADDAAVKKPVVPVIVGLTQGNKKGLDQRAVRTPLCLRSG
jgi:hypothetical protein